MKRMKGKTLQFTSDDQINQIYKNISPFLNIEKCSMINPVDHYISTKVNFIIVHERTI